MKNIEIKALGLPKMLTPVQAHRKRCLDCAGGSCKAVRECQQTDCESWPFRMGKNPNRTGIGGNPLLKGREGQFEQKTAT